MIQFVSSKIARLLLLFRTCCLIYDFYDAIDEENKEKHHYQDGDIGKND
jgi:hypothetical protein